MNFYPKKLSRHYQQGNGLTTKAFGLVTLNAQQRVQNMHAVWVVQRTFSGYPCMTQSASPGDQRNPKTDRLHQPVFLKLQENGCADVAVI